MRPLALEADDSMRVHMPMDGVQVSIQTVCGMRRGLNARGGMVDGWDRRQNRPTTRRASHALFKWYVMPRCKSKYTPTYSECI